MDKRTYLVMAVATAVIATAGAGTASAAAPHASSPTTTSVASAETPGSPDGDTLQQGDQTTPDGVGTTGSRPAAPVAQLTPTAATRAAVTEQAGTEQAGTEQAGTEQAGTEVAGTEVADVPETGPSDGPGGYADPAGSTSDTQQEGQH